MIRSLRSCGVSLAAAALAPQALAAPQGTDLDLTIFGTQVIQAVQNGSTLLVAGKSTLVRVPVSATGTVPPGAVVDGLLRIFVGGVEQPNSPIYSVNGPLPVGVPLNPLDLNASLNFVFLPPQADDVELRFEINPVGPNQTPEVNFGNNTTTVTVDFVCRGIAEIVYVPIDYRPSGGPVPNLPDPLLIEPGLGDNFVQAVYPGPDLEYRRSDAPSKLWTQSVASTGSSLNASLLTDLQLMTPQPDFIYGWVPGSLGYNGQAIGIPGQAAMGNTDVQRHQRTFAHELGHLTGLQHNGTQVGSVAIDVEHHLNQPLGLPQVIPGTKSDVMVAGLITNQAWIAPSSYNNFLNNAAWQCAQPFDAQQEVRDRLLLAGVYDPAAGSLAVQESLIFRGGEPTAAVPREQANVLLRAHANGALALELPLLIQSSADHCDACRGAADAAHEHGTADAPAEPSDAGFVVVLPPTVEPSAIERVEFLVASSGELLTSLVRSATAPTVAFTAPRPADSLGEVVELAWEGADADGDALRYALRYSPDGVRMVPIATGLSDTRYSLPLGELPALQVGLGFVEVLASDGLNTSRAVTLQLGGGGLVAFGGGGNAPMAHILTPDTGKSFPLGATVILHSSGWDLEDRALTGASVVWTSSLDGVIATGRITGSAELSVGVHLITMTATDSGGLSTSDTTTITITDRGLPGMVPVCQTDLGFGGPGGAELMVCGQELSSGNSADVTLTGAAAHELLLVLFGATNNPTPLLGGTLVPVPAFLVVPDMTDAAGGWSFTGLPGGAGPTSLFLQVVYTDPSLAGGFGVSNAVQLDYLP
jgi:hypothetical protein